MDKELLKKRVCEAIDASANKIKDIADRIYAEPELGFKEIKTAAKVKAFMEEEFGIVPQTGLAINGVKCRLKGAKPGPTVAVLGELDAIGCPESPDADPMTGAAHKCGHNLQVASMLGAGCGLFKSGVMEELAGDCVLFGVPAEEYVELAYRQQLLAEGKVHYIVGKGQLIYEGAFDDIDMAMMMHADKERPKPTVSIGSSSNGFVGKKVQYIGKVAHAGDAPFEGINALNAALLGIMGINALRETFKDSDHVRVHPIITKGGDIVNSVPADVRMELYVRGGTMEAIDNTHKKVDAALRAGGDAIGAQTIIETMPGQMPLDSPDRLHELFIENAKAINPDVAIEDAGHFGGSTDMGDVSQIMPAIHPYIGGTVGLLHTKDFNCIDFKACVLDTAKAFACVVVDLLYDEAQEAKEIIKNNPPNLTKEEYIQRMDAYFSK